MKFLPIVCLLFLIPLSVPGSDTPSQEWKVPVAEKTLSNGFRLEPKGRTGFAHLFEHMMFEGTPDAPKGVFDRVIEGGGGWDNGDTRFDFTEYIETAPLSALDPVLWLEADR